MKQNQFLFLLISLLILHDGIKPVHPYSVSTYTITDLDSTNNGVFNSDAANWYFSNTIGTGNAGTVTSYCDAYILAGPYILGSCNGNWCQYGSYFQRTYNNLISHTGMLLTVTFFAIDSWDWNADRFNIMVDGSTITGSWYMGQNYIYSWYYTCGCNGCRYYMKLRVFATVTHSASSLTLRFNSYLDESTTNESFGVRDITMTFTQDTPPGTRYCAINYAGYINSYECNCGEGAYYSWPSCYSCATACSSCWGGNANQCYACRTGAYAFDGEYCVSCHTSCATCFGANSNECKTCNGGYYWLSWSNECVTVCPWPTVASGSTCVTPCTSANQFITQAGACISECPSPNIVTVVHTIIKLCQFPCNPVDYLYWDGTCQQECPSPLDITVGLNNGKVCSFSCDPSQYLYWNGTCGPTCDSPYIPKTQNSRMFCLQPCPSTQSLYADYMCTTTCPTALTSVTIGGVPHCVYPCQDTEYLDWSGTCRTSCNFPLNTKTDHGKQYCTYPTATGNWLYWDGTSAATCALPLTQRTEYTGANLRRYCEYKCSSWEFLYEDGSCVDECPFPLTSRITKSRQFCDYSCTGTNSLDWDGNCVSSCNFPLSPRTQYTKDFCDYPCGPTQYLYQDGTCSDTCAEYYTISTSGTTVVKQFCNFPCTSSPNIILWEDGSCNPECDPPLLTSYQYGDPYCSFPCDDDEYYLYDGTCTSTCDSPLLPVIPVVNGMERYCNFPCASDTDYYYYNGTCQASCVEPLVPATVNNINWCVYPCLLDQYLYPDGSCADSCELPLVSQEVSNQLKFCYNPCPTPQYLYYNGTCQTDCESPYRSEASASAGNICWPPCDNPMHYYSVASGTCVEECPTPAQDKSENYLKCLVYIDYGMLTDLMLIAPKKEEQTTLVVPSILLQYVRYIDIKMPPRLGNFTQSKGRNILTLRYGQAMPETLMAQFSLRNLPTVFEKVGLHSCFIVNFWKEICSWIIILVFAMLFSGFERVCQLKNLTSLQTFFEKLRILARWNILLILITTSVGDITLYTFLELMSLDQDFSISYISIELCAAMIGFGFLMLFGAYYLGRNFHYVKEKVIMFKATANYLEFQKSWEGYQVIYRGFRDYDSPNQYFTLLYMLRLIFPMLLTIIFYQWPIAQTVLIMLFSGLILFYIIKKRPLIRTINFVQISFVETVIAIINISLVILTILDAKGVHDKYANVILADVVVFGNSCINLATIAFLIAKLLEASIALYKYKGKKSKTIWIQLTTLVFQQGGFGFEEMYLDQQAKDILYDHKYLIEDEDAVAKEERERLLRERMANLNDKSGKVDGFRKDKFNSFLARPSSEPTEADSSPETPAGGFNYRLNKVIDPRLRLINETKFDPNSPTAHARLLEPQSPASADGLGFGQIRRLSVEYVAPVKEEMKRIADTVTDLTVLKGKPMSDITITDEN